MIFGVIVCGSRIAERAGVVTKSPSRPVSEPPRKVGSDVRTRPALPRVEPPVAPPTSPTLPGRRFREQRPTLPMADSTAPCVLVVGTKSTEIASVTRSFHDAGAYTHGCPRLDQLEEHLGMRPWGCVMVDLRNEKDVRRLVAERMPGTPVITYVGDATLAHRGRVLPLGRAEAEEILASLAPRA